MAASVRGVGSIEGLFSLLVLSLGILATVGTARWSLRLSGAGSRAARAAWLTGSVVAELRRQSQSGGCISPSGSRSSADGIVVRWSGAPEAHGLAVQVIAEYAGIAGPRSDTMWSFLRCP